MPPSEADRPPPWRSVSDLSEYAYCPRAQWYRHHPPEGPRDPQAERSARAGATYHRARSAHVRRSEDGGTAAAVAIAAGVALLLLGLYLSGVL